MVDGCEGICGYICSYVSYVKLDMLIKIIYDHMWSHICSHVLYVHIWSHIYSYVQYMFIYAIYKIIYVQKYHM